MKVPLCVAMSIYYLVIIVSIVFSVNGKNGQINTHKSIYDETMKRKWIHTYKEDQNAKSTRLSLYANQGTQ